MKICDLQTIYDEREDWFNDWFEKYKNRVTHFRKLIEDNIKWSDDDLFWLIQAQDNNVANNGQWGTIYNTDKNTEFDKIKAKWESDLLPIIREIVKDNDITKDQFQKFRDIFISCCTRKKILAANRVLAAFLPNVLTTTVNESDFYYVEDHLRNFFSDYTPPIQSSWSERNKYFIKYCNKKIHFEHPWMSSIYNWILREYFKYEEELNFKKQKQMEKYTNLLEYNHNLILTGAPGTGKTYLAKQIAQQMIFGEVKEQMTTEEKKQFNEQCGFAQFHPSYDYTDFVEGLRPIQDDNGNVGFERKDGVFKEFCRKALLCSESNETDIFNGINDNPKVWKVSLSRTGENEIRTYCKENNCIRIGWEEYGNVEDFSEYNFKESEVAKDFQSKGLAVGEKILKSFQHEMKIGDFVVSCYSDKETDAIGIITDDYEYIKDMKDNYPRCRKVNWIWKGVPVDITELNKNKKLTLSTIYKLDIDPLVLKDFIKKRMGYAENKDKERKFVFIIDEINRGEISKIFGELFFSIDPGYRGEKDKVQTQYQNLIEEGDVFKDGFYVPDNVYIIGTMNDIDRSVESMDFAFRRRFAFKEVTAEESQGMLDSVEAWGKNENGNSLKPDDEIVGYIKEKMDNLNKAIWHKPTDGESDEDKSIEGLSSAYHIGASYFMKLNNYKNDDGSFDFDKLWEYHLEGLLFEYLRGMTDLSKKLKKLAEAYGYTKVSKYE